MSEQQKHDQTDYQIILEAISKVTLKGSVTLMIMHQQQDVILHNQPLMLGDTINMSDDHIPPRILCNQLCQGTAYLLTGYKAL